MGAKNKKCFFAASSILMILIIILLCMLPGYHSVNKTSINKPKAATHNYTILIDEEEKRLYLLDSGKLVKKYSCAVGKSDTPSPLGTFKITDKSHWGEGFGGYWMGINCPWGDYGIHGTTSPESIGTSASHGCFRMFNEDVEELYKTVPIGTTVVVTSGSYGAFGSYLRDIGPGMYGRDIQVIQIRLKEMGYYNGSCNGMYETYGFRSAVHRFQKDNKLPVSDYISAEMVKALGFVLMD